MAKVYVKDMESLAKYVGANVVSALNTKSGWTASAIKEAESEMVEQKVYGAYKHESTSDGEPYVYERRKTSKKGLAYTGNMEHTVALEGRSSAVMTVVNNTPADERYKTLISGNTLAELVERGHGANGLNYAFPTNPDFTNARPFQAATVQYLKSSANHEVKNGMIADLAAHGFKINMKNTK